MNYIDLFITKYIKSFRKDRLIYEVNSKKKKENFINHFCHETLKYIEEKKIIFHGKKHECFEALKAYNKENFFVLSSFYIDGIMMDLKELELYMENEYMSIVAISDNIAIIKEEEESLSNIFILK